MEEREVLIKIATDWTPAQAQKAFDEQREVQVMLAGEARSFTVAGFEDTDDDALAEIYLRGTLPLGIGEPPDTVKPSVT